jgi:hypothetical protein
MHLSSTIVEPPRTTWMPDYMTLKSVRRPTSDLAWIDSRIQMIKMEITEMNHALVRSLIFVFVAISRLAGNSEAAEPTVLSVTTFCTFVREFSPF